MDSVERKPDEIIIEGRLSQINLDPANAREIGSVVDDQASAISLAFYGDYGFYIRIFDQRRKSINSFCNCTRREFFSVFKENLPAIVSYRLNNMIQYIVIADIGSPDMRDDGEAEGLVLTKAGTFDRKFYRVPSNGKHSAIHTATGICILEPRQLKTIK